MNHHRIPKESLRVFRARFEDPDEEPDDSADYDECPCDDLEFDLYMERENQ